MSRDYKNNRYCIRYNFPVSISKAATFSRKVAIAVSATFFGKISVVVSATLKRKRQKDYGADLFSSGYKNSGYCIRYNFPVLISIAATFSRKVAIAVSATFFG